MHYSNDGVDATDTKNYGVQTRTRIGNKMPLLCVVFQINPQQRESRFTLSLQQTQSECPSHLLRMCGTLQLHPPVQ